MDEKIVELLDKVMDKLVDLERRVDEIHKGHDGATRDELKLRLDDFEKKLHPLLEEWRAK